MCSLCQRRQPLLSLFATSALLMFYPCWSAPATTCGADSVVLFAAITAPVAAITTFINKYTDTSHIFYSLFQFAGISFAMAMDSLLNYVKIKLFKHFIFIQKFGLNEIQSPYIYIVYIIKNKNAVYALLIYNEHLSSWGCCQLVNHHNYIYVLWGKSEIAETVSANFFNVKIVT